MRSKYPAKLILSIMTCVAARVLLQARIHYYWYKKQRALCHMQPVCDMGGFTRLLHTGEADDLMEEIPTVCIRTCEAEKRRGHACRLSWPECGREELLLISSSNGQQHC